MSNAPTTEPSNETASQIKCCGAIPYKASAMAAAILISLLVAYNFISSILSRQISGAFMNFLFLLISFFGIYLIHNNKVNGIIVYGWVGAALTFASMVVSIVILTIFPCNAAENIDVSQKCQTAIWVMMGLVIATSVLHILSSIVIIGYGYKLRKTTLHDPNASTVA